MRARDAAAWAVRLALIGAGLLLSSCAGASDPASNQANDIHGLWVLMFAISVVIAILVIGLFAWAIVRKPTPSALDSPGRGNTFIVVGGAIIPAIVLVAVFAYSLDIMRKDQGHGAADLVVDIHARQFAYSVTYPGGRVADVPELHLPAGKEVRLDLTSDDVIHSFWVPELQGKMDMFPGRTTHLWITGPQPGRYLARCAEFCGLDHATMTLTVVVQSPADFERWLAEETR